MNRIGTALAELHDAETGLARALRGVAARQAADHGTHYPCRTLAQQCDQRARSVRALARGYGRNLRPRRPSDVLTAAAGPVQRRLSELAGRRPSAGLLLLRDLRRLFLHAQAAEVHWLLLGQAAQAVRDEALLDEVTSRRAQVSTQIKWIRTRLKDVAPQVLASG